MLLKLFVFIKTLLISPYNNPFLEHFRFLYWNLLLEAKNKKLKIGFGTRISKSIFGKYNTIGNRVSLNNVQIGDFTYISDNSIFGRTSIGKFCSIGSGVISGLAIHPSKEYVSTHPAFYSLRKQSQITFSDKDYYKEIGKVTIGNDVWIGANTLVLDNITIGNGAIIAAGAVVTQNVPDYAIVGGIPAKIIKYRFEQEEIQFLLQFKWWDKEMEWLQENFKKFHNIKNFVNDLPENS